MSWWIAAALVWLGAGVITALAMGRMTRSPTPDLLTEVERLERQNQALRNEARLAQATVAVLRDLLDHEGVASRTA